MKIQKQDKTKNTVINIVFFCLIACTIIVGPNINDPFNFPKMLILIIFSSALIGILIPNFREIIKYRFHIDYFVIAYAFGLLISFIVSDQKIIAFFGDYLRKNGFISYFSLLVIFFVTYRFFRFNNFSMFHKIVISLSLLFVIYGYLQFTKRDFFNWNNPYNPIILTVGNPNFASALLGTLSVIVFNLIFIKSKLLKKTLLIMLIGGMSFIILKSNSRQGLIVFCIGILVILTLHIRQRKLLVGNILLALNLWILFFAVLGMQKIGPLSQIMYKGSISTRGYYWRAAIKMFFDNPLFGVGLDRYQYNFKIFREQQYALEYGYQITSSNAHNVFLQLFATGGLFVGLPYLILIAYIFIKSLKHFKSPGNYNVYEIGIFAAWLGFQAQSFISIDMLGISIWGWVLSGILISIIHNTDLSSSNRTQPIYKLKLISPIISWFLVVLMLMASSVLLNGERYALQSRFLAGKGPNDQASVLAAGNKVLNSLLIDPYYKYEVALNYLDAKMIDSGISILNNLAKEDKKNLQVRESLAWVLEEQTRFQDATQIREQIYKLDPYGAPNLLYLLRDYKSLGMSEKAKKIEDKILQMVPNSEIASQASKLFESNKS